MTRQETQSVSDVFANSIARWMFFLAGITLLVAALLLPATGDLRTVRQIRDAALMTETHHHQRVARYEQFLRAIESGDQATIELLAQSQLGVIPAGREALILPGQPADPMVFELLEPIATTQAPVAHRISVLEKLTTTRETRFVVILVGAMAVLIGILPPARVPTDRLRSTVLRLEG